MRPLYTEKYASCSLHKLTLVYILSIVSAVTPSFHPSIHLVHVGVLVYIFIIHIVSSARALIYIQLYILCIAQSIQVTVSPNSWQLAKISDIFAGSWVSLPQKYCKDISVLFYNYIIVCFKALQWYPHKTAGSEEREDQSIYSFERNTAPLWTF